MVAIRLARFGKKNHPTFRVVVSDKRKDTLGTYVEQVGTYNPHTNPPTLEFKTERVSYWLSVGAQPSPTVHNLLVEKGLLKTPKVVVAKAKKSDQPVVEQTTPAPAAPAEEPKAESPKAEAPATAA